MSVHLIEEFIEREGEDRELWMWLIAGILNSSLVDGMTSWQNLRKSFLGKYQKELLSFCDYSPEVQEGRRISVKEPQLLLEIMAGLRSNGVFGDCKQEELADFLERVWETKYAPSTTFQKLRGPNSVYSACIEDFFEEIRRIRKEELRNKKTEQREEKSE